GAGGAPVDGGISWEQGVPASVGPPQGFGWVAVSSDPECIALEPGPAPTRLSWAAPEKCGQDGSGKTVCGCWAEPSVVDGQGGLAVASYPRLWFFRPDGSGAGVLVDGRNEYQARIAPGSSGFASISYSFAPRCTFARRIGAAGAVTSVVSDDPSAARVRNP